MRNRTIKPQFWIDEDLARLPRDARLLYIALWNAADDGGVFEYRPERLKVLLFPYDDIPPDTFVSWLNDLEAIGKFTRFFENNREFGFLINFTRHQKIKKPSDYRFASPPGSHQSPTSGELVDHQSPTSRPPVPLGSRGWGVGSSSLGTTPTPSQPVPGVVVENSLYRAYQAAGGTLTSQSTADLDALVADYGEPAVLNAIPDFVNGNGKHVRYLEGILRNRRNGGNGNGGIDFTSLPNTGPDGRPEITIEMLRAREAER